MTSSGSAGSAGVRSSSFATMEAGDSGDTGKVPPSREQILSEVQHRSSAHGPHFERDDSSLSLHESTLNPQDESRTGKVLDSNDRYPTKVQVNELHLPITSSGGYRESGGAGSEKDFHGANYGWVLIVADAFAATIAATALVRLRPSFGGLQDPNSGTLVRLDKGILDSRADGDDRQCFCRGLRCWAGVMVLLVAVDRFCGFSLP
jgi:hypothetical protein